MHRILVINPGSTSSKVAVYHGDMEWCGAGIDHPHHELGRYAHVAEQYALRRDAVLCFLEGAGVRPPDLDAVVGRGGMLRPIPSGTYRVNARMLEELRAPGEREHISNLGALIARVAGLPGIERRSLSHALNLKAAARHAARELGARYEDVNLVVAHLGGGISVSAHRRGRMVDVNQGLDGTGPFAPERAGGLPIGDVMRMAYSGRYTYDALFRLVTRQGGLLAHVGTNDAREVERCIAEGDDHARLIYEAMAYQIAKEIGLMATVLCGEVQAVVLTGGLAYSEMLAGWISERVRWIAPVLLCPGEHEMAAMAQGALRVLRGEEEAKEY